MANGLVNTFGQVNPALQKPQTGLEAMYGVNSPQQTAAATVTSNLNAVLDSPYIDNARQRGVEQAATRGGVNSSIAAGASERAALDNAGNLATQATQLQLNRENTAAQLYGQNLQAQQSLQNNMASSAFGTYNNLISRLQTSALEDPETFTPEVVSGYTNFFQKTATNALKDLLG